MRGDSNSNLQFSVNSWIFGPATQTEIASRAVSMGFDGVDVSGEPETLVSRDVSLALEDTGLVASCVNGNYLIEERSLAHPNARVRVRATDYVKRCVDFAAEVGAPRVVVVPSQIGMTGYYATKTEDWKNGAESLAIITPYARSAGITIALEPVNKYESGLVRSLADGQKMIETVGEPGIALVADTFHMMLEESEGIANSLRRHSSIIDYVHVGDNNRESPGMGCLPWREILLALVDTGFSGSLSFEPLPRRASPSEMMAGLIPAEVLDVELAKGLEYLRYEEAMISRL